MSRYSPARIHADFNGLTHGVVNPGRTAIRLNTYGTIRDLSNAGIVLSVGLPLVAFDAADEDDHLEAHGTAQYDPKLRCWVMEFDEVGVRHAPAMDEAPSVGAAFHCVRCRAIVDEATPDGLWHPGLCCNACGTSALAAVASPEPAA